MVLRHRPTAIILAVSMGLLGVSIGLALGQWDGRRITFPAEAGVEVTLQAGDERIVYMSAAESQPLNFDFYPLDFGCSARGPNGSVPVRRIDHRRLLNLWDMHTSIGSMRADANGIYHVSCSGHRDAPLVLASPARFTVEWVSPTFAIAVLVAVTVGVALAHLARTLLRHLRRDLTPAGS